MYDFSTLNFFEFENLVCDILNSKLEENKPHYQSFKSGKDKGVDLFLENIDGTNSIVQVKHYIKSPVTKLKYDLRNKELAKVRLINPDRYIIATSCELSLTDKRQIKDIFGEYIKSTNDILSRSDLNFLLTKNSEIEEKHFKLWFSSTTALKNILSYKFEGRRKQFKNKVLQKKLRLYVPTSSFNKAKNILKQNKFVIITGEPGVGKTTISDILIYDFIRKKYQINIIYDSIREIEEVIKDDNSKQVFYFDDFLGHTQAEITKAKASENYIIKILNLIEESENKYLILNTRKFILSSVLEESERFKRMDILRKESRIEIKSYSYGVKRRILDLHILESNLQKENLEVLSQKAHNICCHTNFSPRIIEFFTSDLNLNFTPNEFEKFIQENLDNPKEIWRHAYLNQISDYDRFLLNTLYSLNYKSNKNILESHYNSRLSYEVKENNYIKPFNSFEKSLRILNNGFILINRYPLNDEIEVSFINPSLQDFLNHFIEKNENEKERIIKSSPNIEKWFWLYFKMDNFTTINPTYSNFFLKNYTRYCKDDESRFLISVFIYYYIDKKNKILHVLLKSIKDWDFIYERNSYTFFFFKFFLKNSIGDSKIRKVICKLSDTVFFNYINDYEEIQDLLERIKLLKNHYGFNLRKYLSKNYLDSKQIKKVNYFKNNVQSLFDELFNNEYDYLLTVKNEQSVNDSLSYLKEVYFFIQENVFEDFKHDFSPIESKDWEHIIQINIVENTTPFYSEPVESSDLDYDDNDFYNDFYDDFNPFSEFDTIEVDLDRYYSPIRNESSLNNYLEENLNIKPGLGSFTDFSKDEDEYDLPF